MLVLKTAQDLTRSCIGVVGFFFQFLASHWKSEFPDAASECLAGLRGRSAEATPLFAEHTPCSNALGATRGPHSLATEHSGCKQTLRA